MTDFDEPFDEDNTDGLDPQEIAALNAEFRQLWPQWRVRAPSRLSNQQVAKALCYRITQKYFG